LIACAIAAAVGIGILAVVLISGGSGSDNSSDQTVSETFFPPYSPDSPDGLAIVGLARNSIEVLPRGEWPSLYDSFTPEYQQRCPKDQFVAAGEAGAQEQGSNLPLLHFVNLEQVSIEGDTAKAVIVGEIQGLQQYKLRSAMVRGRFLRQKGQTAATPLTDCKAPRISGDEIRRNYASYDK